MDTGNKGEPTETRLNEPTETRLKRWIDSVSTVTLPLLAGFSITSVVVVSDNATNFLWPGATILALASGALLLIMAVQCAYHARVYLSKNDDHETGVRWAHRTRWLYDLGLAAVLLGLALVVLPRHATKVQAVFQLIAFALAVIVGVVEVVWAVRDKWLREPPISSPQDKSS